MDGRGEQGPAPRQDPLARAADPAGGEPEDDGGGENVRLCRRIIKKIVKDFGTLLRRLLRHIVSPPCPRTRGAFPS